MGNMKHNFICIIGILEEESEQWFGNLFEEIMTKKFPRLVKKKIHKSSESEESPKQDGLEEAYTKTHHN